MKRTGKTAPRGVGLRYGSTLAEVREQLARLVKQGHVGGMTPWICIFQTSPRRWSYGIRFYPAGQARQHELTGPDYGTIVRPIEKGA